MAQKGYDQKGGYGYGQDTGGYGQDAGGYGQDAEYGENAGYGENGEYGEADQNEQLNQGQGEAAEDGGDEQYDAEPKAQSKWDDYDYQEDTGCARCIDDAASCLICEAGHECWPYSFYIAAVFNLHLTLLHSFVTVTFKSGVEFILTKTGVS